MASIAAHWQISARRAPHPLWVRWLHWIMAGAVITLAVSGSVILASHPRLYWGETGNDMMPALIELPISRNYRHGGWEPAVPFRAAPNGAISAARTYDIFNQNGWGRSLHFLCAWIMVVAGGAYIFTGTFTGHLRRVIVPKSADLAPAALAQDVADHAALRIPAKAGPPYGPLQKIAYSSVVLLFLPLMVLTGLAMSPQIGAATGLMELFTGSQSARTIHFAGFAMIFLFILVHVAMVLLSGPRRHLAAMILGRAR